MQAEQALGLSPQASGGRPSGSRMRLAVAMAWAVLATACATPPTPSPTPPVPPAPSPASASLDSRPAPAVAPPITAAPPAPPPSPGPVSPPPSPVVAALEHAERLRGLPGPELAGEVSRLGATPVTPLNQMLLALALKQGQQPSDAPRVQALLQAVLANDSEEARGLRALARLLLTQHAQQQRLEEQLERQAQQLRDSQRRSDQLSERLEALRALERSMPSRPVR